MHPDASFIQDRLATVARLRAAHAAQPLQAQRVAALKAWQQARLARSHLDLLTSARYGPATRFFLDELYGPADFTRRDQEFSRIVGPLTRLFSAEVVRTVSDLMQLHALSEELDDAMAREIGAQPLDAATYGQAWRNVGRPADRERQITLVNGIGTSLDHHTHSLTLRQTLRLMRGPARAAGLGTLQTFLEHGFDAFRGMRGADDFLATVATRERALAADLFSGRDEAVNLSPYTPE